LLLADEALERLGAEGVLFVPAATPPHKPPEALAPAADRYAMVELAVAGNPRFTVTDIELSRPGPSYTVDTLERLHEDGRDLYLLIGSETFLDLLSWRAPRRVAQLARLVVVPRVGSAFDPDGAAAQKVLRAIGAKRFVHVPSDEAVAESVLLLHATSLPVSASELRRRAREGRSLAYRLPASVIAYIAARGLYGSAAR
jgi:nicotinate-nucleotide adenylyltransferase